MLIFLEEHRRAAKGSVDRPAVDKRNWGGGGSPLPLEVSLPNPCRERGFPGGSQTPPRRQAEATRARGTFCGEALSADFWLPLPPPLPTALPLSPGSLVLGDGVMGE